jgi:hypothetical protein
VDLLKRVCKYCMLSKDAIMGIWTGSEFEMTGREFKAMERGFGTTGR